LQRRVLPYTEVPEVCSWGVRICITSAPSCINFGTPSEVEEKMA